MVVDLCRLKIVATLFYILLPLISVKVLCVCHRCYWFVMLCLGVSVAGEIFWNYLFFMLQLFFMAVYWSFVPMFDAITSCKWIQCFLFLCDSPSLFLWSLVSFLMGCSSYDSHFLFVWATSVFPWFSCNLMVFFFFCIIFIFSSQDSFLFYLQLLVLCMVLLYSFSSSPPSSSYNSPIFFHFL